MNYKPMLAVDCGDVEALRFPVIISPKLDGVRAIKTPGTLLSRKLIEIPNKRVQEFYAGLPDNLDGELLAGPPTAPNVYRETVSMVMSDDKPIDGLVYHVFDRVGPGTFRERLESLQFTFDRLENVCGSVTLVPQVEVNNVADLRHYEALWVGKGYEGVIIRDPESPYKHGRSTLREGFLLKWKRFEDGEAEVIGVEELMHNANEATVDALGHTKRSHKKAGKIPAGVMGKLIVRDTKTGVEFKIGSGFDFKDRKLVWDAWVLYGREKSLPFPRLVKYKHQPCGAKDKPRIPVFIGWRDRRDT